MKKLCYSIIRNINSAKVTALIFMLFIVYVGLAAVPQFLTETADAVTEKMTLSGYVDVIDELYSDMLSTSQDCNFLQNKGTYINLNGLMANILKQPEMNERFKLKNGHLAGYAPPFEEAEVKSAFENINNFYERQIQKGGDFLFVLAPSQIYEGEALLPTGYEDYSNDNADLLVALLRENDIPVLDLRESLKEQGISGSEAFMVTDHHWKPQTGFWAYAQILEKLEQMGAISEVDEFYTDADNFEFCTYEDSFLGSAGKRTGQYFAGLDDFSIIIPEFDTEISVKIDARELEKTGRYEDTAYRYELSFMDKILENPDYFNANPYGCYGWGDMPLTSWRNEQAPEKKRFMLIGDSMGNIPFSLLSLYISSCDELDMRHYEGDFPSYYSDYDPDTVVFLINAAGIVSTDAQNLTYDFVGANS